MWSHWLKHNRGATSTLDMETFRFSCKCKQVPLAHAHLACRTVVVFISSLFYGMARNPWNGTVQKNLPALVKTMRPASCGLLDQLYAERLINREELFKLKSLDTEEERARELLTSSLPSKGPQSFDKFCDQVARCEGHQRLVHLLHAESARTIPTEAAVTPNGESTPPEMEQAASSQEGDHRNRMLPVPAGESTVRFGHRKGAQPKRISFYVPPPCNSGFKAIESKVKSSCGTAGISKSNVKIVYESVDDDSGEGSVQVQPPQEGAHSVVFDEVMLVSMVLYGISAVEFELDAFIADVLSAHLNVPREAVSPKEALDGCCLVIVSLPFEAIVSLFEILDDPEKSFQLTKSLKAQIPNLSHVEVMMGNLCLPMPVLQPPQTREELVDAALHIPAQEHLQRVLACRLSEEDKVDVLKASCSKLAKNLDPVDSRSQSWKDDYLFYAAGAGQLEMCDALLEHGTHPGVLVRSDNRTLSAIHAAAQGDHVDIVTSLLTVGVPVNSTDNEQNTPLHWASWYGNYNTVEVLLKEGADPQSMNSCGYAPLHYAAACGNLKCISQLTEANAQIDSATKPLGLTPLHIAVQEHQIDAVQLLLNLKANPVACTKLGLQPIHLATWSGNHRCLKLLLEQGVGSRDESLLGSPMKLAEIQGHLPAVVGTVLGEPAFCCFVCVIVVSTNGRNPDCRGNGSPRTEEGGSSIQFTGGCFQWFVFLCRLEL